MQISGTQIHYEEISRAQFDGYVTQELCMVNYFVREFWIHPVYDR